MVMDSYSKNKFEKFPICDTNILIYFGLIDKLSDFVKYKKNILVADVVKRELDRKVKESNKYKFIISYVEDNSNIILINKEKYFDEEKLCVMKANLKEYEIEEDCLLTNKLCPNLGEFVSAIYAVNLGIKVLITHDITFINKYKNEEIFKTLVFKNMVQTLDSFVGKDKRKQYMKIIKQEAQQMQDDLNQEKVLDLFEKWQASI